MERHPHSSEVERLCSAPDLNGSVHVALVVADCLTGDTSSCNIVDSLALKYDCGLREVLFMCLGVQRCAVAFTSPTCVMSLTSTLLACNVFVCSCETFTPRAASSVHTSVQPLLMILSSYYSDKWLSVGRGSLVALASCNEGGQRRRQKAIPA
jgi:hypothetical protein